MKEHHITQITTVFDDQTRAERAITELRRLSVTDTDLSFIARNEEEAITANTSANTASKRATKKTTAETNADLLFGLTALAIPKMGPFITAKTLASALGTTGGALAADAIVDGTSNAITGGLSKTGYSREESEFYGPAVERGGILMAINTKNMVSPDQAREVLTQKGERTYGR